MLKQFPPQTSFNLNGPHLSFIQNPVGVTTENGYPVTLVGIATASFKTGVSTDSPNAPANPAVSTGTISYQWYEVGLWGDKKVVDDVDSTNGVITGSATTTLTIQRVMTPQDDGKQYYLTADYIPSTITGDAHNEPIRSGIGTIEVLSVLEITKQPESASSFNISFSWQQIQQPAQFDIEARVSGKNVGEDVTYQWYFDSGTDSYGIKPLYRHYNAEFFDHYCSDSPIPASGYQSQGVLCRVFTHQAPGTIAIIDAEPDTPTVDKPDTGIVGYAYPTMLAALQARLGSSTNSPLTPVYNMVRNDDNVRDEMWSISPTEGVIPTTGTLNIEGDDGTNYILDTTKVQFYDSFKVGVTYTLTTDADLTTMCYAKGAGGGYSVINRGDGGNGGLVSGRFTFLKDKRYILRVGGKGTPGRIGESSGTTYASGTTYTSLTYIAGEPADIFESSAGTNALWGRPTTSNAYTFSVNFTNLPVATKSIKVYIFMSEKISTCALNTDDENGQHIGMQQFDGSSFGSGKSEWISYDFNYLNSANSTFSDSIGTWFARDEDGYNNVATVEWDPTGSWDGEGALKLTQNNSDTPRALVQVQVPDTGAEETYTLSFRYKSGSGFISMTPVRRDYEDPQNEVALSGSLTTVPSWRYTTIKFKTTLDLFEMGFRINSGGGSKVLYIDDVVLMKEGQSYTLESVQFAGNSSSDPDNVGVYGIEIDGELLNDTTGYVVEYNEGGWNGGGNGKGYFGQGGSGGGFTGLFDGLVEQDRSILIAAGGGGESNDGAGASAGGGLEGQTLTAAWNRRGGPGTQNNGGEGGGQSQSAAAANGPGLVVGEYGSALQGGSGAGGGGGGYFGGGGGVKNHRAGSDGAGGGGSSYVHPILISNGENVVGGGGKGTYNNNEDGSFLIEVTNYGGGTTYSGVYYSGTPNNIFDGNLETNLHGRPNNFVITFTNLPIPTTSLRFYIVQESGSCVLTTGESEGETSITCGTFEPSADAGPSGGVVANFLSSSNCTQSYLRPNEQSMSFNASVPLQVSAGDIISVLTAHDTGGGGATIYLDLILRLDNGAEKAYEIGVVPWAGTWNPCSSILPNESSPGWISTSLIQGGTLIGLKTRGGYSHDAVGLGQMQINGTLIYPNQTYTTKSSSDTTVIKEGRFAIHPGNGDWVNVGASAWTNKSIKSLYWTGGGSGDGCGLYAIEIDGKVLGQERGYINRGIKFYAPTEAFTTPTSSLLLNDGDLVKRSTTWEFTGAPDEYSSYIVSALPLNEKFQFTNQSDLISGGAENPAKNIVGNTVASEVGSPNPLTIVTSETMSELEGGGIGAKFYGSCARKPLKVGDQTANTSYIRINLAQGAQFGTGPYTMEWWQWVDQQDFGDKQTRGVDFNYPPARDSYYAAGVTPFIRIENTWNHGTDSRIRYYKWNAQHRNEYDTIGYGGYLTYSQWQHIAITRDDTSRIRIFIDGITDGGLIYDSTDYTGTDFYCITGIHPYTDGYYVQDHRIYSGVAKYTDNFTPPSQMLLYSVKEDKTFNDDGGFLLPSNAINIKLEVAGAKGGNGGSDMDGVGGIGGKGRQGIFLLDSTKAAGEEFVVKVGNAGNDGPSCSGNGGSGGIGGGGNGGDGLGCSGFGGGGGGATSVGLVKWGDGFIVAGGGGGGGGGSWERDGDNGSDCGAFISVNSSKIGIDPGLAGSDANMNGAGGGGGGGGVSGGDGGSSGIDKNISAQGGRAGTSQYYSVITTYYRVQLYRDYSAAPLYDHYVTTDPEPAAGFSRDGKLCKIYKHQAPHTVAIRDNDEPSRHDGPIMGYAYPNLQAVYNAGLSEGNVRPIYRLEGSNAYGFYDIMWSIHEDEGYPVYQNTGVKFYAPWAPLTVTDEVGGDTFSILESETLNAGDGFVHLSYEHTSEHEPIITEISDVLNIAGSKTPYLKLKANYPAEENLYCQVSSPLATNSPVETNKVTYTNSMIEGYLEMSSIGGGIISKSNINLANGDYMIGNWSSDTDKEQIVNYMNFASRWDDVEVEMDMYGGKGEDGLNSHGGQGGFSRIQFTIERGVEYVIAGLTDDVRAPFLYRKSNLMAVVGGGGQGGDGKEGGSGGGVGVRGGDGTKGNDYGAGGDYIPDGTLDVNGEFGSSFYVEPGTLQPGDVSNNANELMNTWQDAAGRTIKCSKGPYWIGKGYSPCQDMGVVRYVDENGIEPSINNNRVIERGFKPGYNIMQTAALGKVTKQTKIAFVRNQSGYRSNISVSGSGGNGAAGGKGAIEDGGGGGGSGYQDGSVTVIHTQQGGSEGKAKVIMRLKKNSLGGQGLSGLQIQDDPLIGLYKDVMGRILILSSTDISDPRSLPTRTNVVEPGGKGVIDDGKWQYILDLARDGTKDYRLAVCAPDGNYGVGVRRKIAGANPRNIWRMMNANRIPLRDSLRGWVSPYNYNPGWATSYPTQLTLAWDETSGATITGSDYSLLWWVPGNGWGYYGGSSNSFFSPTIYYQKSAEWWLLPPGVPDF